MFWWCRYPAGRPVLLIHVFRSLTHLGLRRKFKFALGLDFITRSLASRGVLALKIVKPSSFGLFCKYLVLHSCLGNERNV